ncbi:lipopolysaccharide assembly LapA domain-containing protein [bacterium]
MQKLYMILAAAVLLLVAIFAGMNSEIVPVRFIFMGELKPPAYILILICFFAGGILMALFDLGGRFRTWQEIRGLNKQVKSLEEERDLLKKRVEELGAKPAAETTGNEDKTES